MILVFAVWATQTALATGFPLTQQTFCYPTGTCDFSTLVDGTSSFVLQGGTQNNFSGYSVSSAGDVNGDGLPDLVIGGPGNGKGYVIFGSKNSSAWGNGRLDLSQIQGQGGFVLIGEAGMGWSVSGVRDLNGDGFSDLVIGAPYASLPGSEAAGKVYVVFGSNVSNAWGNGNLNVSTLVDGARGFVLQGERYEDASIIGISVNDAGDVNGDGFSDLVIGGWGADPEGRMNAGKSYVVFGSNLTNAWGNGVWNISSLMNGTRGFVLQGEVTEDCSGVSVSGVGDVNGDGVSDLGVGARCASPPGRAIAGKTYVLFGSRNSSAWGNGVLNLSSLINGGRGFVLQGEATNDFSGRCVSEAGDVNGDEVEDLLIGALSASPLNRTGAGNSYVVFGSKNSSAWGNGTLDLSTLMDGQRGFVLQGESVGDASGVSVSKAGDVNGDGISDLIIGALQADPNRTGAGKSYVVFGSKNSSAWGNGTLDLSTLVDGQRGFVLQGESVGDANGFSVSGAGDLDSDGLSDVVVGSPYAQSGAGKTYVVFGKSLRSLFFAKNNIPLASGQTISLGLQHINILSNASSLNLNSTHFTVFNLTYGVFTSQNGTELSNFFFKNIIDNQIQFTHDGSLNAPQYRLLASHPQVKLISIYSDAQIDFNPYPPTLVNNQLPVEQGVPLFLNSSYLNAVDANDLLGSLSFTITNLTRGQFNQYDANGTLVASNISYFTQLHVTEALIQFIPDNSRVVPYYWVSVGDSQSNMPPEAANISFNYAPELHFRSMIVDQGQATLLGLADINVTDVETVDSELTIEIANVTGGHFVDLNNSTVSIFAFKQSALMTNDTQFVADDDAQNVSFALRAFDGRIYTLWEVPFVYLNRAPLVQAHISDQTIAKERVFDITFGSTLFVDPDNDNLTYSAGLSNGEQLPREIRFSYPPLHFEGQMLGAEAITIQLTASDPRGLVAVNSFVLKNFNNPPVLNLNTIVLDEGQPTTLRYQDINASDVETFVEDIIIETQGVTEGSFVYANSNFTITTFRQFALIIGTLQFLHSGGNRTPGFVLRVFDGVLFSSWQAANVTLNRKPLQQHPLVDQIVTQDQPFSFNLPNALFHDPDGDLLTYTAHLQGGAPLPKEIQFISPNRFEVNLPIASIFPIEVQANDPRKLKVTATFSLSSRPPSVDLKALYTSFSSLGGVAVTILAYLWLRKRIARHRRGFPFANVLRKVLNLEYYDFMRFDGEIYRSKTVNFLQRLQLAHQDFFSQLTVEEQNSFAVCVAEILTARGMVSPSDCGYGFFGILCCLNVGWPSQLNLKQFEAESVEIAAEAVASWKNYVQYKFRPMSDLEDSKENNTIYLEVKDNLISYIVLEKEPNQGKHGTIQAEELGLSRLPDNLKGLRPHLPKILRVASKNGDTRSDKARRWLYHSPSLREKLKVFCCLQRSHAKTFVTDVQLKHAIELEKLKKHEAVVDVSLATIPKDFASEFESKEEERWQEANAEMKSVKLSIETVSTKVSSVELSFMGSLMSAVQLSSDRTTSMEKDVQKIVERIDALESRPLLGQRSR